MTKKQKILLTRIIVAAIFVVILELLPSESVSWYLKLAIYMIPYLTCGYDVLYKAGLGIKNGQMFDENLLMSVATIGAIGVGIYEKSGDFTEAVAVMLLYQLGELFQAIAVGKSRRNISDLMDIRPDYANLEAEDKSTQKVDPDEVEIGSIIVVKPGEKVPIDGVVVEGTSTMNTAALTGESIPRDVTVGDDVLSGFINQSGVLRVKTTTEFDESTASKILDLVENASSRKSKSENFIYKFAKYYTPIVFYAAIALIVLPSLFQYFVLHMTPELYIWIYRACTFLVISCPCAVVISIPLTFFAGIGGASSQGILVKGSNYLETLSEVKTVVFDKTGTITKGNFEVSGVHHNEKQDKEILEYAALAECHSSHPISLSLKKAFGKHIDSNLVTDVEEIGGNGITATVKGKKVAVGNDKLMDRLGIKYIPCTHPGTIVHVAINDVYEGHILITDEVKPNAKEAISSLKNSGVKKTVMLTGDAKKIAEKVASDVGVDEVKSELLPADKVSRVEELLKQQSDKDRLAFVGDGINDAPVLTRADIGIAMGALGSDAAIEAADIVLMDDDPVKISKAIRISRKCMRIVYENIYFALGVKFLCLILGALGIANMWIAIISDVGVMILCVLNAIRVLFAKRI
ncbi:Cd2+/Zn2+-exporting ATPase [Acetitomaculum ruminis DSM 5522]|uniref:Cd(2+)-exporting ATPase n=1 Tax=Acetitomaculum ruminis DSM 5522 TaxID=1120918 RepID=A0A1I0ZX02_9FIRM|nr:heavy metal translocating P-type ATPase [Acetitomaculum ruminis]SFB29606.1 Cd2+/Zn2+-exporting ATPase [Acetitomaculum ruminis DSM 5522]